MKYFIKNVLSTLLIALAIIVASFFLFRVLSNANRIRTAGLKQQGASTQVTGTDSIINIFPEIQIITDSSVKLADLSISQSQANSIINLIDKTKLTDTYSPIYIDDIRNIASFDTVKSVGLSQGVNHYYVKFLCENHSFYVSFAGEQYSDGERLIPEYAFFADRLFSVSEFDSITVGNSTINDIEAIDPLALCKNSKAIKPSINEYEKITFHITDDGVLFLCYTSEDGTYNLSGKFLVNSYPQLVNIMKDASNTQATDTDEAADSTDILKDTDSSVSSKNSDNTSSKTNSGT